MKKIIFTLLLLFTLCGCKKNISSNNYNKLYEKEIYAYNIETEKTEKISIFLKEKYNVDIIYLYIENSNIIPYGYSSFVFNNINLEKISEIGKIKSYYFDDTDINDLKKLYRLVSMTNELDNIETVFILNYIILNLL